MLMKISTLIFSIFLLNSTCMAMPAFLEPAKIIQQIKSEIAKAKIDKDIQILDTSVIDGIGQGVKLRYDSEPSYVDQYYTRIDQYTLNVNANLGTLLGTDLSPIGFSLTRGSDITFARQFKSQLDSVIALPYTPLNIPFTVEKMNKLKVGDFVGFTTTLNLVTSINAVLPVSAVNVSLGAYALVQGQFMVHLFKMNDTTFRIKIIALKSIGKGVNVGVNLISNQILCRAKQISIVGGRVAKFVDITPLVFGASKTKSNLVVFDYVFNTKDSRAVEAYNNFSIRKVVFKDTSLANPFKDFDKVDEDVMTDLTEIDAIALEDSTKPQNERAIDRIFSAKNNSTTKASNIAVKFNVVNVSKGSTYTQNKIKSTDRENNPTRFLFDSLSTRSKTGFLFDYYGVENNMYSNLLFKANENFEPTEFADLIFSREIKINQFTEKQYKKIKEHVKQVLPESIYNEIEWKNIDFSKGARVNGFFKNQVTFTLAALAAAPILSKEEAYQILMDLLKDLPRPMLGPVNTNGSEINNSRSRDWRIDYESEIQFLAAQISAFLDNHNTPVERYNSFMSVKNSEIWREVAVKFFLTILPPEALQNSVRYELVFEAKDIEATRFKHGSAMDGELYKNLMYIQSIISNRSFDLRLYTNDNGEFLAR